MTTQDPVGSDNEYAAAVGCEPLGPPPGPETKVKRVSDGRRRRLAWSSEACYRQRAARAARIPREIAWPGSADLPVDIRAGVGCDWLK